MPRDRRHPDRPRVHPKKGPGRVLALRLKAPDAERLTRALDGRGLSLSSYLRGLVLDDLDTLGKRADAVT